jgi:cyclic pyranopterin phosphate synthase
VSLKDRFGRVFKTLRLSVTDRCDLRCNYCMPAEGIAWKPQQDVLSFEELERLTKLFVNLGMQRIRLTGGEPLLRQGLPDLVGRLARIPGIEDLSLTTNGTRLAALAGPLKKAGLQRVTVSLDSLDAERFKAITRGGDLDGVWQGLLSAERAGLGPIKLNCGVLPENEADLLPLAALTMERRWEMRFIEVMPVSSALGHQVQAGLSLMELKERLTRRWGALEAVPTDSHAPARRYRLPGSLGKLGFIASVSESFCSACDRLRLSATGRLQLCMAHPDGLDLRALLRGGVSDARLMDAIAEAVWRKPAGHAFYQAPVPAGLAMSQIGG